MLRATKTSAASCPPTHCPSTAPATFCQNTISNSATLPTVHCSVALHETAGTIGAKRTRARGCTHQATHSSTDICNILLYLFKRQSQLPLPRIGICERAVTASGCLYASRSFLSPEVSRSLCTVTHRPAAKQDAQMNIVRQLPNLGLKPHGKHGNGGAGLRVERLLHDFTTRIVVKRVEATMHLPR